MTLKYLTGVMEQQHAASVSIVTLLDKPAGRRVELKIQYSCIKATPHNSGPT